MIPNAKVTKNDGATGVVRASAKGICAIIALSSAGTANQPAAYTKPSLAVTDFGYGVLTDCASYVMSVAGNPVVLIKGTASTAGTSSAVAHSGAGTSVVTQTGTPNDDYKARLRFLTGATIGVSGATFKYSLDGGVTESATIALGTANSYTIPNSGVTFAFAAGTVLADQTESCTTVGPKMTTDDVTLALEALRTSSQPWEMVLVAGHDATAATVTLIDTWLAAREAEGRYRAFVVNAVMRDPGTQTEAQYATAMATAFNASATIRGCVAADGGDCISTIPGRGITQKRPASLALTARLMKINYGVDAAYVNDGPVPGFLLADSKGNPNNHDENNYPGLDALRLVALRTFDRKAGTFITNPNVLSSSGSDFVWMQHVRTMNRACEIAYDVLTQQLSAGVHKSPKLGPNGEVYIAEEDAQRIDELVNQALAELRGQVNDLRFTLSRNDDIGSNGPVILHGDLKIESLAYVKEFDTNASFARTISVQS